MTAQGGERPLPQLHFQTAPVTVVIMSTAEWPYPVGAIEGIGEALAARLQLYDVIDTNDLLLSTASNFHAMVADTSSLEIVTQWRRMAALLQVEGVDPQIAEALVYGGIRTVEELAWKDRATLTSIFATAAGANRLPASPTDDQILCIVRDATLINSTGFIAGVVLDEAGSSAPGATVRYGSVSATTNERGRFRLLRIPLGRLSALYIDAGDAGIFSESEPRIAVDNETISEQAFQCGVTATPLEDLDEFNGDTLPPFNGPPITTDHKEDAFPRDGDLLYIQRFYDDGTHAKLVSWLRAFVNGRFVVRTYKVELTNLPGESAVSDIIRSTAGELKKTRIRRTRVATYRQIYGALKRKEEEGWKPASSAEIIEYLNTVMRREQANE